MELREVEAAAVDFVAVLRQAAEADVQFFFKLVNSSDLPFQCVWDEDAESTERDLVWLKGFVTGYPFEKYQKAALHNTIASIEAMLP